MVSQVLLVPQVSLGWVSQASQVSQAKWVVKVSQVPRVSQAFGGTRAFEDCQGPLDFQARQALPSLANQVPRVLWVHKALGGNQVPEGSQDLEGKEASREIMGWVHQASQVFQAMEVPLALQDLQVPWAWANLA